MSNVCLLLSKILGSRKWASTPTYTLSGVINDSSGSGLDGVTVTLTGDASDSVVTAGGGAYSFTVPDGSYTVTPTLLGSTFSPTSANVAISGGDDTAATMAQVWAINGTIVDGAAAGISGVTVALSGDATDSDTTDVNGAYSFAGLSDGSYTVTPTLAGYIFVEDHEDVTVAGDNVTVDNMVRTYISLPFSQTFESFDNGNVAYDDGWRTLEGSAGVAVVQAVLNDSNAYTPPGITKVVKSTNGTTYHPLIQMPFGLSIQGGLSAIRLAILYLNDNGAGSPFVTASIDNYQDNGNSNSINNMKAQYSVSSDKDVFFYQWVRAGVVTQALTSQNANNSSNRWMWSRFTLSTSGTQTGYWVRKEDSSEIATKTTALALPSIPQMKYLGWIYNNTEAGNCYIAKIWIGSGTDDWPT